MKVSIIVPAYNAEKYIDSCINKLLKQTYKNIEIVVVNDGSKDNTKEQLDKISNKNVKIINLDINSGAYYARRTGIKNATGDYIMFVDSDDYIDNNTVEELVNIIKDYNADIIKFRLIKEPSKKESPILFNGQKKPYLIENEHNLELINELLTTINLNNLATMIIKKELLKNGDIDRRFNMGEDFIQACYAYTLAQRIVFIDNIYYHYSSNPDSTMKSINESVIKNNLSDLIFCNKITKKFIEEWNVEKDYKEKCNIRTYNSITRILMTKMCMSKEYSKSYMNNILDYLFNNNDYIDFKSEVKYNSLVASNQGFIKRIIKKTYMHSLYKEDRNKLYILGKAISKFNFLRSK